MNRSPCGSARTVRTRLALGAAGLVLGVLYLMALNPSQQPNGSTPGNTAAPLPGHAVATSPERPDAAMRGAAAQGALPVQPDDPLDYALLAPTDEYPSGDVGPILDADAADWAGGDANVKVVEIGAPMDVDQALLPEAGDTTSTAPVVNIGRVLDADSAEGMAAGSAYHIVSVGEPMEVEAGLQ